MLFPFIGQFLKLGDVHGLCGNWLCATNPHTLITVTYGTFWLHIPRIIAVGNNRQ